MSIRIREEEFKEISYDFAENDTGIDILSPDG